MAVAQGSCPGCGAPIEFAAGSSVSAVCKYCNTTVRRGDRGLENLGKLADLANTPTTVAVGDGGSIAGESFVVLGRVQLQHDLGGVWDEWYLGYGGGRWGWLAYAQGNFYVTWSVQPPPPVPGIREMHLEAPVPFGQAGVFRVVELKQATIASAEGELPFAPKPGQNRLYADLVGPRNGFATIDWGEGNTPPEVFLGYQLPESQLTITQRAQRPKEQVDLEGVNCPGCGAPLAFAAGKRVERVACRYCGTLCDTVSQHIIARQDVSRASPLIALGSSGTLDGVVYTVVGFVARSTVIEGERFEWTEYLLFSAGVGFRWLVEDEGVWRFVSPLNVAEVDLTHFPNSVSCNGRTYTLRNQNTAQVDLVLGEFYWRVQIGETVDATDLQSGSDLISREAMQNEVAWSYAVAMPWSVIASAFNVQGTPPPVTASALSGSSGGCAPATVVGSIVLLVFFIIMLGVCTSMCDGGGSSGGIRGSSVTGGGWSGGK